MDSTLDKGVPKCLPFKLELSVLTWPIILSGPIIPSSAGGARPASRIALRRRSLTAHAGIHLEIVVSFVHEL